MKRLSLVLFVALASTAWAQTQTIVYQKGAGGYNIQLLDLALKATVKTDGAYELKELGQNINDERAMQMLNDGKFDVAYMTMNKDRAEKVLPIEVELSMGFQGYRLFIIHKDSAERFKAVKTLEDLRKLTAGFGAQWGDYPLLVANGLKVEAVTAPENLYPMLQAKRFDYFPRGANEIWGNLERFVPANPDLIAEPTLAFAYPYVQYFVVAKGNTKLADRIKKGLAIVAKDGSWKKLFLESYKDELARANLKSRRIFMLTNPSLPEGTPAPDTSWWLK